MLRFYRHARYKERLDLSGQDLISLAGQPKEAAKSLLPMLRKTADMSIRLGLARSLRAENGEVADEVHEFGGISQGGFELDRLLVRKGRVVELRYRW